MILTHATIPESGAPVRNLLRAVALLTAILFTAILLTANLLTPLAAQSYRPACEKLTLPNGVQVVLHPDATAPIVSINVAWFAGSARDPKGKSGLASAVGRMMLPETRTYSDEELVRLQRDHGVRFGVLTGVDWSAIYSTWPSMLIDSALAVEADRMAAPGTHITSDILRTTISVMIAEERARSRDPFHDLDRTTYAELYPASHPYRRVATGDTAEIRRITLKDVRAFCARYYAPANACITIAGRFDPAHVRTRVSELFGALPAGRRARWTPPPATPPIGATALVSEKHIEESRLYITFPTVGYTHPDAHVLSLLARLVAGSANARLQRDLLNTVPGLQSIQAAQTSLELHGNFTILLTGAVEMNLRQAYVQVMRSLNGLLTTPPHDEELLAARNAAEMEFLLPLELISGTGGRADAINIGTLYTGNPLHAFEQQQRMAALTATTVTAAARRYFSVKNQLVINVVAPGRRGLAMTF